MKPLAPRASAAGPLGAAAMMVGTLSFLVTTPEAWREGHRMSQLSVLGASLLTAADSLSAADRS
ncbi:DUF417 family protein [Amycolatopsis sp. NPDC049253]|uniref:DUF417 family protein n=1 Tax=Amycolatopsis sp. NPDC049253 TaxID=3155274 RepID=UPI003417E359